MKRMVFAFALAALTFVAAYGTSNAAPIAPLPERVATGSLSKHIIGTTITTTIAIGIITTGVTGK